MSGPDEKQTDMVVVTRRSLFPPSLSAWPGDGVNCARVVSMGIQSRYDQADGLDVCIPEQRRSCPPSRI